MGACCSCFHKNEPMEDDTSYREYLNPIGKVRFAPNVRVKTIPARTEPLFDH